MTTNSLELEIAPENNNYTSVQVPKIREKRLTNPQTLESTVYRSIAQKAPEYYPAEAMLGVSFVSGLIGGIIGYNSLEVVPYLNTVLWYLGGGVASIGLFTACHSASRGVKNQFRKSKDRDSDK